MLTTRKALRINFLTIDLSEEEEDFDYHYTDTTSRIDNEAEEGNLLA
jgi:hypothetical protein